MQCQVLILFVIQVFPVAFRYATESEILNNRIEFISNLNLNNNIVHSGWHLKNGNLRDEDIIEIYEATDDRALGEWDITDTDPEETTFDLNKPGSEALPPASSLPIKFRLV